MPVHLPPPDELADWHPIHENISALRSNYESLEQLVEQLFTELESAHERMTEAREELETSRLDVAQITLELAQARTLARGDADPALKSKCEELERDRTTLETELEAVRLRAAELSDTVSEQKVQMAEERSQWTTELRQMRRLLEKQSDMLNRPASPRPAAGSPSDSAVREPQPAAQRPAADPVLGSVMAQFEMLQKDIARRRAKNTSPSQ